MKIHSLSKVLGLPFVLVAVAILYYSATVERSYSVYIFIPVFFIVALYVFHGIIDHWWLSKYPIEFDPKLRSWLENHFSYYYKLNEDDKKNFEYRLGLYIEGRLFKSVGSEHRDVPEDIKCMVAAHGIAVNMGFKDYLIGDVDRIFLYKHPFPTPSNHNLHNVETHIEDGVIILSLEQLTQSILDPKSYYNVAYFAYVQAFVELNKNIKFDLLDSEWHSIEKISGLSQEVILEQIGVGNSPKLIIYLSLFFSNPEEFKLNANNDYEKLSLIFKQRP